MFWNGNYVATREVSVLLKEEDVTLSQLIEADDIIQECQAKNTALVKFLTRGDVISDLVSLITEEPSHNVELQTQYRYSTIACEILTSGIGAVNDRLSSDVTQMHRLCDFIARDPPLNPLLASFFSRTIKALLEQSPKQDWYSYNIICLRVLDFLKSRSDFLPNLFRHIGTSAIMDTFKYLIRLEFSYKVILQWFEDYHFVEVLIQMICGTYIPEKLRPPVVSPTPPAVAPVHALIDKEEKGDTSKEVNGEHNEQPTGVERSENERGVDRSVDSEENTSGDTTTNSTNSPSIGEKETEQEVQERRAREDLKLTYRVQMNEARIISGRSANAANLMCEIILFGCYGEGCNNRPTSGVQLMAQMKSERAISQLLQSVFTCPLRYKRDAVVNSTRVILAALQHDQLESDQANAESRRAVVAAVAPHLPLLHQTLLESPQSYQYALQTQIVGMARLQVATLIAALVGSPAEEVSAAIIALGTLATLLDLFFACPGNNLLHAQTYRAISAALHNNYQVQYAKHLIIECDLLRRLMDAYEENLPREGGPPRKGYMGHVVLLLELLQQVLDERLYEVACVPDEVGVRWAQFKEDKMQPLFRETPLGGYHPADKDYDAEISSDMNYDMGVATSAVDEQELGVDDNASDEFHKYYATYNIQNSQLGDDGDGEEVGGEHGARERKADNVFDDDDDTRDWADFNSCARSPFSPPAGGLPGDILDIASPWESASGGGAVEEGWAQFSNAEDQLKFGTTLTDDVARLWRLAPPTQSTHNELTSNDSSLQSAMQDLSILNSEVSESSSELVSNLLSAITAISPDTLASLVDTQLSPEPMDQSPDPDDTNETEEESKADR